VTSSLLRKRYIPRKGSKVDKIGVGVVIRNEDKEAENFRCKATVLGNNKPEAGHECWQSVGEGSLR
jgi:hypothetical protein